MKRSFYRCTQCLTVAAVIGTLDPDARCGACELDGYLEFMGYVRGDRLTITVTESVCDSACTSAKGPDCGCVCSGKNHGSGSLRRVVYDRGPVPVLGDPDPKAREKALAFQAALAAAEESVNATYGAIFERKRSGEFLDAASFALYLNGGRKMRKVHALGRGRTHARTKSLRAIAEGR